MRVPASAPPPPPLKDAHNLPPPHIRNVHRELQKPGSDSSTTPILDIRAYESGEASALPEYHLPRLSRWSSIPVSRLNDTLSTFSSDTSSPTSPALVYSHASAPGLFLIPNLLPVSAQRHLLTQLLTRELPTTSTHKTNLHLHYRIPPSPFPFFTSPPTTFLPPLDPTIHKPLPLSRALTRKLRWMTLGGQYDWTSKTYPSTPPPSFPPDIAALISGLFPDTIPQAAIANFYSPGDRLSPHRDVSEASNAPLISLSVGCSAVFIVGVGKEEKGAKREEGKSEGEVLAVRIRSGDAVVMAGESRWAWHSIPRVEPGTCPEELGNWPGGEWEGWMRGKRVNLNVRQMWD